MKNSSCPREIKEMDPIVINMPISQTKKCFENYGYTLCPWWPEEIFRLSNWLMMFHCVWTSKDLLFFMHWFTFWFCHLQVFLCMTYLLFDTSVYKCLTFPLHVPNTKTEQTPPSPFLDQKKITHCKFLKSGPLSIETGIFFIEMPGKLHSLNRYRWSTFICLLHNRAFVSQRYENVAVLCQ